VTRHTLEAVYKVSRRLDYYQAQRRQIDTVLGETARFPNLRAFTRDNDIDALHTQPSAAADRVQGRALAEARLAHVRTHGHHLYIKV
jgi:hypothetical protein